jgi:arylsulfatase A-like enzyme
MRRRVETLAVLVLVAACGRDEPRSYFFIDDVVTRLGPPLAADAVVEAAAPVRSVVLRPDATPGETGARTALTVPPPAVLRFRITVPPAAALRFGIAVCGAKQREPGRSGVEFRVTVDGSERFSRTLNPAARSGHRHWLDALVPLDAEAGRTVSIGLETRPQDPALPLAGVPGWSGIALVQRTRRDRQAAAPATPNLLVLLVDTLRADRLGPYGAQPSPTPTLDALARTGLVFDDAVSQSSWTLPSVATLLTGLLPRSHGVLGTTTGADQTGEAGTLADELVTWSELAQRAGLSTFGVSANPLVGASSNARQGFETFVELPYDSAMRDHAGARQVNERFLEWLARHRPWRFAAYLHYMDPHDPYTPPRDVRPVPPAGIPQAIADGRILTVARAVNTGQAPPLSGPEITHLRRLYDGEIVGWDRALAMLLRGLEAAGVRDSTVIVVTADHGEEFQEHGRLRHGSQLFEETVRVPFIVVGPGIPAGRRADTSQGIDFLPTIAGLLGLPAPPGLPGRDLMAGATGPDAVLETGGRATPAMIEPGVIALRTPRWKLIRTPELERVELYDRVQDPGERSDLGTTPEAIDLARRLDLAVQAAPPPPRNDAADATLNDKLRALGYVE